ncbi:hypothetical protein GWK48_09600 [Metallosphaera tengchongensis]|uniref:Sulfocyanin-like C-terminal domain-containing protein n=1 Tax=Metallosphaera tengchongensis TaxID=1532350 RepID=A0A6N0NYE9_9CREN|nr:sulfocyanin-like copper-binding protein [Metallosphaera tengchongensis]QKR00599.1 hypothetical protein GWK48_09600 [Metallosphaera tengchongensis]
MKVWQIVLIIVVIVAVALSTLIIAHRTSNPPVNQTVSPVKNVTSPPPAPSNSSSSMNTTSIKSNNVTNVTVKTNSTTVKLPSGASPLNYNASNRTVFIYLYASNQDPNPLNFNGTTYGTMKIYVPENWSLYFTFYNPEPLGHALAVVQNNTAEPNQLELSQNGKIIFEIGYNGGNGISGGVSVSGLLTQLPRGYYWIACPIPGHAQSGMWIDLISTNVTVPYVVT